MTLPSLGCSRDMLGATQLLPPTWSVLAEKSWKHHFHSHVFPEEMAGKPEFEWLEGFTRKEQSVGPGAQERWFLFTYVRAF